MPPQPIAAGLGGIQLVNVGIVTLRLELPTNKIKRL
jgi:hypothetical protein